MTTTATPARVNYAALSRQARDTIKYFTWDGSVTIAGYVRFHSPDGIWRGDTCGCTDDRCIGYHHEGADGCGCLEALLEQYAQTLEPMCTVAAAVVGTYDRSVGQRRAREGEVCACGLPAFRWLFTSHGETGDCGLSDTPAPIVHELGDRGRAVERPALQGEACTCGRQARRVLITRQWGAVGDCGLSDGAAPGTYNLDGTAR